MSTASFSKIAGRANLVIHRSAQAAIVLVHRKKHFSLVTLYVLTTKLYSYFYVVSQAFKTLEIFTKSEVF